MRKIIKTIGENRGQILVETKQVDWPDVYDRWEANTSEPCPMPVGHPIFADPERFGYVPVTP